MLKKHRQSIQGLGLAVTNILMVYLGYKMLIVTLSIMIIYCFDNEYNFQPKIATPKSTLNIWKQRK